MKLPEYRPGPPVLPSTHSPFMPLKIIGGLILLVVCVCMFFFPFVLLLARIFH